MNYKKVSINKLTYQRLFDRTGYDGINGMCCVPGRTLRMFEFLLTERLSETIASVTSRLRTYGKVNEQRDDGEIIKSTLNIKSGNNVHMA